MISLAWPTLSSYREYGVVALRKVPPSGDHSSYLVDLKSPPLVVLETVGDHSVGSLIIVAGDHPVHLLRAVVAAALGETHLKDLVVEKGAVVVLVLHSDDHRCRGTQGRAAIV